MPENTRGARDALLASLRRLGDDELVARLKGLAGRERRATALLVAHLAELDTRDVHLRAGYSSLFAYCCDVLALSEHEALSRIDAARTARRFPVILDLLAAAEINLTTVRLLGPHLTADNHVEVLASARGQRKAGVEEIVARLWPRPDVPASVRKLLERKSPTGAAGSFRELNRASGPAGNPSAPGPGTSWPTAEPGQVAWGNSAAGVPSAKDPAGAAPRPVGCASSRPETVSAPLAHSRRSAEVTPLSPDRYKYQLTIGGSTLEKLRLAKDMLRRALPSGDDEAVLDRALTALLTELARRKFGGKPERRSASNEDSATERCSGPNEVGSGPKGEPAPNNAGSADEPAEGIRDRAEDSRYIPVEVKRAVWLRDLGRCAFIGPDGHRCAERAFVEFHHVRPYAVGGKPTIENLQLRCGRHNGYEARVFFAREPVDESEPREPACAAPPVSEANALGPRTRSGASHRSSGASRLGQQDRPTGGQVRPLPETARRRPDTLRRPAASA